MAESHFIFDIEGLNALALRLRDHAEDISAEISFELLTRDMRLAATLCSKLATLRFRIAEIAEMALTQATAATRRDLLHALAEAGED
jgi:hypothetical protein